MIFLLALLFVLSLHLFSCLRSLQRAQPGWALAHTVSGTVISCGAFWGLFARLSLIPTSMQGTNWTVWALLVGGVMTLVLAALRLLHLPKRGPDVGIWSAAFVCGVYLCFVVGDHLWFFRDADKTAVGYASMLQAVANSDVSCPHDLILINLVNEPAQYRCPSPVLFGPVFREPLAPWPTYTVGESASIHDALARLGLKVQ